MSYVWNSIITTLSQILILLGPGLALGFAMHFIAKFTGRRLGYKWNIRLVSWIGTPIHEIGHAFFCVVFGHKITEIQLFHPDPVTGTLGFVNHRYNSNNMYHQMGNFFIGVGPIIFGTVVLILLSNWLLDINLIDTAGVKILSSDLGSWLAFTGLFGNLWDWSSSFFLAVFSENNLRNWQLYVFLYLDFAIGSHISLSKADLGGVWYGLGVIIGTLLLFNLATGWIGDFTSEIIVNIANYFGIFYAVMFLALILNILFAFIVFLLPHFARNIRGRS
ncbi:hypothetical protein ACFLWS_01100 [Chloroflexota bacterium]